MDPGERKRYRGAPSISVRLPASSRFLLQRPHAKHMGRSDQNELGVKSDGMDPGEHKRYRGTPSISVRLPASSRFLLQRPHAKYMGRSDQIELGV